MKIKIETEYKPMRVPNYMVPSEDSLAKLSLEKLSGDDADRVLSDFIAAFWRKVGMNKRPAEAMPSPEPMGCQSGRDGDCNWNKCPQNRDGEPSASDRHCPLDGGSVMPEESFGPISSHEAKLLAEITALKAERDALRDALEALVIANEFELPAIRDGKKANERLDILSRCTREARATLNHDGRA